VKLVSLATVLALSGSVALVGACSQTADDDASADAFATQAPKEQLVISQVYGGGGNANAPFSHDFVELFNRGTKPVSLDGKALQYATSVAAFKAKSNVIPLPKVIVEPGRYFLVQLAGGGEDKALPKPDFAPDGAFGLSQEKGKVAIVRADAPLDECGTKGKPCAATDWIDLVGFGSASQAEGSPAKATDKDKAAVRSGKGCVDTGNNAKDFVLAPPAPRNLDTPPVVCETADGGAAEDAGPADDGGHAVDDGGSLADATLDGGAGNVGNVNEDAGAAEDASVLPDASKPPAEADEDEEDSGTKEPTGPSGDKGEKKDDEEEKKPSNPGSSRTGSGGGKKGVGSTSGQAPSAAPATSTTETSSNCSMTPGGRRGSGGALSLGGVLLALAALGRRRR
jgi:hypothetical protein